MTAEASCHGDTAPTIPSRRRAAATTAPTISTASANTDPAGWTGPCSGSISTRSPTRIDRAGSAFRLNARSQPRTVDAGRSSRAAIGRCPAPAAFCRNAAPITSALSARRSRHAMLNNTCVTRQPAQRTRRGRICPAPRTVLARA